jgi:hypothetical protein
MTAGRRQPCTFTTRAPCCASPVGVLLGKGEGVTRRGAAAWLPSPNPPPATLCTPPGRAQAGRAAHAFDVAPFVGAPPPPDPPCPLSLRGQGGGGGGGSGGGCCACQLRSGCDARVLCALRVLRAGTLCPRNADARARVHVVSCRAYCWRAARSRLLMSLPCRFTVFAPRRSRPAGAPPADAPFDGGGAQFFPTGALCRPWPCTEGAPAVFAGPARRAACSFPFLARPAEGRCCPLRGRRRCPCRAHVGHGYVAVAAGKRSTR